MKVYGLIGYPLTHSFSTAYFKEKFRQEKICDNAYRNFEIPDIHEMTHLRTAVPNLAGLNVTLPYKESVIPFLDQLDPVAEAVGAVNVIRFFSDGTSRGYNTDVTGFQRSILPFLDDPPYHALVLGTGGASKSVAYVLETLKIPYVLVSRTPVNLNEIGYDELDRQAVREHNLIINATPLGMHPNEEGYPRIPYAGVDHSHLLFDLVYNPEKTRFLEKGQEHGARVVNGTEMLRIQAEESWKIWNSPEE